MKMSNPRGIVIQPRIKIRIHNDFEFIIRYVMKVPV